MSENISHLTPFYRLVEKNCACVKMMGASMNNELENQRHQLDRVQDRADENRDRISKLNRKMNDLSR
jgi:septation ring formation regulator EzrA